MVFWCAEKENKKNKKQEETGQSIRKQDRVLSVFNLSESALFQARYFKKTGFTGIKACMRL